MLGVNRHDLRCFFKLFTLRIVSDTFQVVIYIMSVLSLCVSNLASGRGMPLAWCISVPAVQRLIGEFHR